MPDLIAFLEKNGFYPRREDIEAILRRLDHDANKMLSFEEFCEAVGPETSKEEDDEESKDAHQFERTNESPLRKAQEEQADSEANEEPTQSPSSPRAIEKSKKGSYSKQAQPATSSKTEDKKAKASGDK